MGRGFTFFMLGAALGFCGGQKTERMFGAAKPSSILVQLSQLRDYLSGDDPDERRVRQQVEESLSRETARITAELKEMQEEQVQMFAAIADELKRLRDGRPDDQHGSSSSRPS